MGAAMPREPHTTGVEAALWDLTPEGKGGGPPRRLRMEPLDVREWIARDPARYVLHLPEDTQHV